MRMRYLAFTLAVLAGCDKGEQTPRTSAAPAPGVAFAQPPPSTPQPQTTTPAVASQVVLTAVTLADDCGGTPPHVAPPQTAKAAERAADTELEPKAKAKGARADRARAERRCEQTSMQLAITAGPAATVSIKSVELLAEDGSSLGMLTPSMPTQWSASAGRYEAWDETLPANTQANVSYVLSQPNWSRIGDRWNRTYTLKTVVTIGGVDSIANKSVTLSAPTTLPPNVKT